MNIAVIGCNGQLGRDLVEEASARGHIVTGLDLPAIDLSDPDSIENALDRNRPDMVINTAAYTAVDACETHSREAFLVNETGVANLARCAASHDVPLVHISTDYVFDGTAATPYREDAPPAPASVYGRSKRAGEDALIAIWEKHWIVRIAWLYGKHGTNFVKSILRAALHAGADGTPLRVVNDQYGSPTWTMSVCNQILCLAQHGAYGLYHATAQGYCTWYDFAREIIDCAGISVQLLPCTTAQFPRPAPRPAWSVLENRRLGEQGIDCMPEWKEGFHQFWNTSGPSLLTQLEQDAS